MKVLAALAKAHDIPLIQSKLILKVIFISLFNSYMNLITLQVNLGEHGGTM